MSKPLSKPNFKRGQLTAAKKYFNYFHIYTNSGQINLGMLKFDLW